MCAFLYRRYRKPYLGWWALAWGLYLLRIGAIATFLATRSWTWLYWHQVLTGWTALTLLWAALVFSRQVEWRPAYAALWAFPLVWSYIAIYHLQNFLLAAGPAVRVHHRAELERATAPPRPRARHDGTGRAARPARSSAGSGSRRRRRSRRPARVRAQQRHRIHQAQSLPNRAGKSCATRSRIALSAARRGMRRRRLPLAVPARGL